MAWIKVETHTPDKPEIIEVARLCKVSEDRAFTAWFRLWVWLDSVTDDGYLQFLTPAACDKRAGIPGIGDALASVGWLEFDKSGGVLVLNWDRHNGKSAKRRAEDQRRKENSRRR